MPPDAIARRQDLFTMDKIDFHRLLRSEPVGTRWFKSPTAVITRLPDVNKTPRFQAQISTAPLSDSAGKLYDHKWYLVDKVYHGGYGAVEAIQGVVTEIKVNGKRAQWSPMIQLGQRSERSFAIRALHTHMVFRRRA